MNTRTSAIIAGALTAVAITASIPGTASASSFTNKYSGSDRTDGGITTLNYSAGHASFTLRLNVDGWASDEAYTINMYDRTGKRVWGASVKGKPLISGRAGDQTYSIGSNVTRISVDPKSWTSLVKWSRA
ncbi:hypothetical protein QSJ18_01635 [Gordonia sp. ABSL1-1]|uniref:hypothetical protein n=1 Tax=Gordonia sp. ABSL1-1 TaxID=3053923 RepID=UPI0025742839|nr:hypothetical protein [Gordonia sp. ABSL1-1]MDL9935439.1 hypothetical protein [Gordonia sp. ABSL1-1]